MISKDQLEQAHVFALDAHGGQTYGGQPYAIHLAHVADELRKHGVTDNSVIAAGYLHDVIEDTHVSRGDIAELFGDRVADIVDAVTDGEGLSRRERKKRPERLIPTVPGALIVKLADRIANVTNSQKTGNGKLLGMYRGEHRWFRHWAFEQAEPWSTEERMITWLDFVIGLTVTLPRSAQ